MSDSREGEEEESSSREEDELIPSDGIDEGNGLITRRLQQQPVPGLSVDHRKEKGKDKKGSFQGNRRKMQAKAKHLLLSPVRRLDKQLEGLKNRTTETTSRLSAAPFPYDGEDFGGTPSPYLCFLRPSISSPSALPIIDNGTAETPGAAITVKPKNSSYYYFLKSLIENNDFYSPECNVHKAN